MLRRLVKGLSLLVLATFLLQLAGCGGDEGDGGVTPDGGGGNACDLATAPEYKYVVNSVTLPTTNQEAEDISLDIDNLPDDIDADNALGLLLVALGSQLEDININQTVDEQLRLGSVVVLVNVKATDLSQTTCAGTGVYLGNNDVATISPAPCTDPADPATCGKHLEGTGSFQVDENSPTDSFVAGTILNNRFFMDGNDQPGSFTIELALDSGITLPINLVGARVEIDQVSDDGLMMGTLGGAITEEDLDSNLLPTLQEILNDLLVTCTMAAPACCPMGDPGELILQFFDTIEQDCVISLEEIRQNDTLQGVLQPDIDLFNDATGAFEPNTDEIDSMSLGLRFTAVPAQFDLP